MTKEEFIKKAQDKFGKGKYIYDLLPQNITYRQKIYIICPKHGKFKTEIRTFLGKPKKESFYKNGKCLKCWKESGDYIIAYRGNKEEILKKREKTCLKKYGVRNTFQSKEKQKKIIQTNLKKYGCQYASCSNEVKQKIKNTNKKRYGYEYGFQSPIIQDKLKQTFIQKYGVNNPSKNKKIINKIKRAFIKKYGVDNIFKLDKIKKIIKEKSYITKIKNGSFGKSKIEDEFYKMLLKRFKKKDVIRQYKEVRYPFMCDFYIKSMDLFIELNLFWTHGEHPFNKRSKRDLEKLKIWKKKKYNKGIDTWTKKDILKIKTAKKNKLNYYLIYNKNDIEIFKNKILNK